MITPFELCVPSLRMVHANLLCTVPILTDVPFAMAVRSGQVQHTLPLNLHAITATVEVFQQDNAFERSRGWARNPSAPGFRIWRTERSNPNFARRAFGSVELPSGGFGSELLL
jgi:hypothetical protein